MLAEERAREEVVRVAWEFHSETRREGLAAGVLVLVGELA